MSEHSVVDGRSPGRPVVELVRPSLDVLLETKLQTPRVRREWVRRPGLVRALDDCESRLILVDAPAGYGKTTLLAQWGNAAAASRPFAWVSLDRGDDDPARLWQHVVGSLRRAFPHLRAAEILRPLQRQAPDVEEALARLVNELSSLAAPVVIVLDDYHVIRERRCHEQLEFLLLRVPPSAQVVLSTRAGPPLPLGRLRAAGEITEIRMLDLNFTSGEADTLIQRVASVQLGQQALADLVERTEGRPAGLYLAALSLRGHPAPQDFVRDFTGGNRYAVDYLAEEVVSRQPTHIRQFLSRTSVLSRFTAPLCDAVAGTSDARDVLGTLERENLFLIALDDNREWFRYHHLFAQLQLAQLARAEPGTIPPFTSRASAWQQALAQGSSIALVRMVSFAMMSLVAVQEGRLDQAEQLARSAQDVVLDDALGLSESPQASIAAIAVGAVLAGQGHFEDARGELERALRSRRQWAGISQWPRSRTSCSSRPSGWNSATCPVPSPCLVRRGKS